MTREESFDKIFDGSGNAVYDGSKVPKKRLETLDHSDLGTINSNDHHSRYTDEEAQDSVGGIAVGGNGTSVTYNDSGNSLKWGISTDGVGDDELDQSVSYNFTSDQEISADLKVDSGNKIKSSGTGDTFRKFNDISSLGDNSKDLLIDDEGFAGMVVVNNRSLGKSAIFLLNRDSNSVALVSDPSSSYSTTEGNNGTTNVYWDSTNSRFEIENKSGNARGYGVHLMV